MIKSFKHKGLQRFFETGNKSGIQAAHVLRLQIQLTALDSATSVRDIAIVASNWKLHPLVGDQVGRWSITVSGNWRLTFEFEDTDVILVNYEDYH